MGDEKKVWEDLRREARFLENEIDAKLVSFSKIGANTPFTVASEREGDTAPLPLGGACSNLYRKKLTFY